MAASCATPPVLSAVGIDPDERRRVLGVSVALSEAEVHWRAFLESLQAHGLRGVEYIVSDDHAGLRAARRAVLGGATWQRCQLGPLGSTDLGRGAGLVGRRGLQTPRARRAAPIGSPAVLEVLPAPGAPGPRAARRGRRRAA